MKVNTIKTREGYRAYVNKGKKHYVHNKAFPREATAEALVRRIRQAGAIDTTKWAEIDNPFVLEALDVFDGYLTEYVKAGAPNKPILSDRRQNVKEEGERLKKRGMELAAQHRGDALVIARIIAKEIAAEKNGYCHMDEVRRRMPEDVELGPAAGSVFKEDCWEFTGTRIKSKLAANHAREIKVWRLSQ